MAIQISKVQSDICEKSVKTYGVESKVWLAIEEMAELADALAKYRRRRTERMDIVTEIADVVVMMQQLAHIFGEELVNAEIEAKINRLAERIHNNVDY